MIDLRLHDQVVEQGRLLLQLLAAVRERNGDADLGSDTARIAEQLLAGLDRLYSGLDIVVSFPGITERDDDPSPQVPYAEVIERVRDQVSRLVTDGAAVAVVSRGDAALVDLPNAQGWHYPQNEVGTWAGYHPRDGAHAMALLDQLRARGASYLVVPATSGWWLDWYAELSTFVEQSCTTLVRDDAVSLFALPPVDVKADSPVNAPQKDADGWGSLSQIMALMLPAGATVFEVAARRGDTSELVARAHGAWGTGAVDELVIDDGQLALPLLAARESRAFLVVDADVNSRLRSLPPHARESWQPMNCVFERDGIGAIFELSDQIANSNATEGVWV